jgi:hypothetical protein
MRMTNETEEEMSEQNKTLARRWFEDVFSRGDLDATNEILSAEFVDHLTHEDERGLEELKHYVSIYRLSKHPRYRRGDSGRRRQGDSTLEESRYPPR